MGVVRAEMAMMKKLVLMMTFATLAAADSPPHFWEKAATARWLVHKLDYGVLSTTSSQLDQIAFGNPQSFSDGPVASSSGKLYFYVSDLDASAQDLAVDNKCSLSLSLQMLGDYCTKEWAPISISSSPPPAADKALTAQYVWWSFSHCTQRLLRSESTNRRRNGPRPAGDHQLEPTPRS